MSPNMLSTIYLITVALSKNNRTSEPPLCQAKGCFSLSEPISMGRTHLDLNLKKPFDGTLSDCYFRIIYKAKIFEGRYNLSCRAPKDYLLFAMR